MTDKVQPVDREVTAEAARAFGSEGHALKALATDLDDDWYMYAVALMRERMEAENKRLREALEAETRSAIARCVQIAKDQREDFLSERYAFGQPLSSMQERFACDQVINAIMQHFGMSSNEQRVLCGLPTHAEEYAAPQALGDTK